MEKKLLELEIKAIKKGVFKNFKNDGEVVPILFVFTKGEVLLCPFPDMDKKREFLFFVGKTMMRDEKIKHIDGIAMVSEAWVSQIDKDDPRSKNLEDIIPREDPNKKEAVIITALTDTHETLLIVYKMKDKEDKKKRKLVSMFKKKPDQLELSLLDEFWRGFGTIIK